MAIATAAAIGLGVAGIGSALSARSTSKAAGTAADTSMAVAQQNNQLARDIYGKNEGYLGGYAARGDAAGNAINALLGLGTEQGGPQQQTLPGLSQYGEQTQYGGSTWAQKEPFTDFGGFGGWNIPLGSIGGNPIFQENQPQAQPAQGVGSAQEQQENAFDVFRNSTGYQFRLGEGANALNSNYAGAGVLRSGAAAKSMQDYAQNTASNEFGNYIGYLSNQQGAGLSGASALAGVGQNYVNNVSANNNSAGTAAANAALIKGQNNPFGSFLGTAGGFLSSYGG